jgi:hypothetical protein
MRKKLQYLLLLTVLFPIFKAAGQSTFILNTNQDTLVLNDNLRGLFFQKIDDQSAFNLKPDNVYLQSLKKTAYTRLFKSLDQTLKNLDDAKTGLQAFYTTLWN